jgi:hypothetical protein
MRPGLENALPRFVLLYAALGLVLAAGTAIRLVSAPLAARIGDLVTAFHHCLEGRSLLAWIPEEPRSGELYHSFLLRATKECALPHV